MLNIEESCKLLGIESMYSIGDLDESSLKKIYRKKMIKYHPDSPTGDTDKATKLTDAYKIVLSTLKELKLLSCNTKEQEITTILELNQLIKLYDGESIKLRSSSETKELKANELIRHNIFINVNISINADGVNYDFNEINKYDRFDNYKCDCCLYQTDNNKPIHLKINCYGTIREFDMSTPSVELLIRLDKDIKVKIHIDRKIIKENN